MLAGAVRVQKVHIQLVVYRKLAADPAPAHCTLVLVDPDIRLVVAHIHLALADGMQAVAGAVAGYKGWLAAGYIAAEVVVLVREAAVPEPDVELVSAPVVAGIEGAALPMPEQVP